MSFNKNGARTRSVVATTLCLLPLTAAALDPPDGPPRSDGTDPPGAATQRGANSDGFAALFDGRTLDGWTQRGGQAHYAVEDGAIVGTTVPNTPNSFLCTDRRFADFELELEFKVDPRLNSGVQIRSNAAPGYQDGRVHGYQVEIDPSDRAWTAGIYDESRRGWLADLKDNAAARDAFRQNAWNRLRVVARGPSIRTWLNGVPAADLHDELTHTGFVALQVHSGDSSEPLSVRWRNIRLRDLGDPWRSSPPGAVVLLDDAGDLSRWHHPDKPDPAPRWNFRDGFLEVEPGAGNLVTRRSFGDCRLHVEFAVDDNGKQGQANGNSGVYVQQRYEVQILNSAGRPPADNECGGIYKVKPPDYALALPAGQWQTYDIQFRAPRWDAGGNKTANARMTVCHNGTRIHDDVEIPDKTGGGQAESPDGGPLLLQDHGNRIRFRNIWVLPSDARTE